VVTLRTNPVQYNPVTRELKVAIRYRVTVHFQGADLRAATRSPFPHVSKLTNLLSRVAFNAQDLETDQTGAGSYLIVCENDGHVGECTTPAFSGLEEAQGASGGRADV